MISAILGRHKNLLSRKDEGKRIKDENKDAISFRFILYPLSFSFYYSPNSFFSRWITSAGCATTSLASDSSSSPPTGPTSQSRFFASANSSGSLSVLVQASRRILIRSGGTPGVVTIGRPNSLGARTTVARRRPASGVL